MDETIIDMLPLTIVELAPVRDDHGKIVDFTWVYANEMANRVVLPEGGSIVGQRVCDIDPAYRESDMFGDAVLCIETGQQRELFNSSRTGASSIWKAPLYAIPLCPKARAASYARLKSLTWSMRGMRPMTGWRCSARPLIMPFRPSR